METGPRKFLLECFSKDEHIPQNISVQLAEKRVTGHIDKLNDQKTLISQIFADERINLQQKESIATAILNGDYRFSSSKDDTRGDIHDREMDWPQMYVNRREAIRTNFIELVSSHAPTISNQTAREVCDMEKLRKKHSESNMVFSWGNDAVLSKTPDQISRSLPVKGSESSRQKLASLTLAMQKSRDDFIQRRRQEIRGYQDEVIKQKHRDKEFLDKKKSFKKRISTFRKTLHDRLIETGDPMLGAIMRCVDEDMAHYFMEKFQGCTMSIDDVIGMIGQSLGSDEMPASYIAPEVLFQDVDAPVLTQGFGVRANPRAQVSNPHLNQAHLDDLEHTYFQMLGRPPSKSQGGSVPWNSGIGLTAAGSKVTGGGFKCRAGKALTGKNLPPVTGDMRSSTMHSTDSSRRVDSITPSLKAAVEAVRGQLVMEGLLPSHQPEKALSDDQLHKLGTKQTSFDDIACAIKKQNESLRKTKGRRKGGGRTTESDGLYNLIISPEELEMLDKTGTESNTMDDFLNLDTFITNDDDMEFSDSPSPKLKHQQVIQIPRVTEGKDTPAPRSLKSRGADSTTSLPPSPYKSTAEAMIVYSAGLASGVGMSRPVALSPEPGAVTRSGRWKTGALTAALQGTAETMGKSKISKFGKKNRAGGKSPSRAPYVPTV